MNSINQLLSQSYSIKRPVNAVPTDKTSTAAQESAGSDFAQIMAKATTTPQIQADTQPQIAPPGGSSGVANDLLRLLGAKNEGNNATSAANGQSTSVESFFSQTMRSSTGNSNAGEEGGSSETFSRYIKGMIDKAYS